MSTTKQREIIDSDYFLDVQISSDNCKISNSTSVDTNYVKDDEIKNDSIERDIIHKSVNSKCSAEDNYSHISNQVNFYKETNQNYAGYKNYSNRDVNYFEYKNTKDKNEDEIENSEKYQFINDEERKLYFSSLNNEDIQKIMKFSSQSFVKNINKECTDDENIVITGEYTDECKEYCGEASSNDQAMLLKRLKSKDLRFNQLIQPNNLPPILLGLFSFIIANMILLFLVPFYSIATNSYLYVNKFNVYHFSEYLYRSNLFMKIIIIGTMSLFITMSFTVHGFTKQRLAVPELQKYKMRNDLFLILSYINIFLFLFLTFLYYPFIDYSENLFGLCDNILFPFLLIAGFFYCKLSLKLLKKLEKRNQLHDSSALNFKKRLVILQFSTIVVYILSMVISSYYEPIISVEKVLTSFLIIIFNFCSIVYFILFTLYLYSMKYDISYLLISLQAAPHKEFFDNLEEEKTLIPSTMHY